MQGTHSRKENFFFYNTLTGLVKALEGKETIIDLRSEACVCGLIKTVDCFMNVEMENATFYDPQGKEHKFRNFFVSSRNIRYVHIPKQYSATELMEQQIVSLQSTQKKRPAPVQNFKTRRAKKYNEEIKLSLQNQVGPSTS